MLDVLVAGGGPAGLATAIWCARAGLSVAVAEPRSFPVDKACGEGLMPSALQRLAALGVHPAGHPIRGIRYLGPGHQAEAALRRGTALGVRRTELHAALSARMAALPIDVLHARVLDVSQDRTGVTAVTRLSGAAASEPASSASAIATSSSVSEIRARYLVAADGLHSPIRQCLRLDPRAKRDADPAAPHNGRQAHHRTARYGLRRHYWVREWTDMVEVHWARDYEAYVTPVATDLIGVAVLGGFHGTESGGNFETRLEMFPALRQRLSGAVPASDVRGAGPLRQEAQRRVAGRVLLVGDAAGYLDALTGEGIGVALAEAEVLAGCLAAGDPGRYERGWRRVTRKSRALTAALLWSRHQPLVWPRIVPAAHRLPWLFTAIVDQVAWA